MPPAENKTAPDLEALEKDKGFEARHQKELGAGQFAKVSVFNSLFPLVTGAAAAALGYFVLAKPTAKLLPKKLTSGLGAAEALGKEAWDAVKYTMERAGEALAGPEKQQQAIDKVVEKFKTTPEKAKEVVDIFNGSGDKHDKLIKITEALGRKPVEVPETIK